ncbi:MAG: hypothetical protein NT018_13375 [Armatimonadetes bacterium]|nr:hypothetical protein [Armatimonadota bacterium]
MDKLKEWLKDKKNQPIVAGALILVLVVAGVVIYMTMSGGSNSSDQTLDNSPPVPNQIPPTGSTNPSLNPSERPTSASSSGLPTAQSASATPAGKDAAKPAVKKVVKTASVLGRIDPFLPVNWKAPPPPPPPPPQWVQVPDPVDIGLIVRWTKGLGAPPFGSELQQPPRRMAGLLLNGRIYAIIESPAGTELVQPGDMLKDGLAVVDRIDRDKVVLETTVGEKRYITVRMASASKQDVLLSAPTNPNPNPSGMPPRGPLGPGGLPRGPGGGLPRAM